MAIVKRSFLSDLIGKKSYDLLKDIAKPIVTIGSCILAVLFLLSLFVHWHFLSSLLNLFTGTSLVFWVYVISLILVLDIKVDEDESEGYNWSDQVDSPKTKKYKFTIVWGVLLIVIGLSAIFFSNRYRKQYAFDCCTILVDKQSGIYHLKWIDDCELAEESEGLVEMKGYEIRGTSLTLCKWCEEYEEEVEDAYRLEDF